MSDELTREQVAQRISRLHDVIGNSPQQADEHKVLREIHAAFEALYDKVNTSIQDFIHGKRKLCLVCGAKEPCELKDDPYSPCSFEPTPMELYNECKRLRYKLSQVEHERNAYRGIFSDYEFTASVLEARTMWDKMRVELISGKQEVDALTQRLATAQARIEALEEESRQWEKESLVKLLHERDALRRRVARLSAALKDVVDLCEAYGYQQGAFAPAPLWCYPHIHKCSVDRWRQILADEPSAEAIKQSSVQHEPRKAS